MSAHLLTSHQIADRLGKSEQWVRRQANAGTIPGFRVGKDWRFTEDDLAAFLDSRRSVPASRDPFDRKGRRAS